MHKHKASTKLLLHLTTTPITTNISIVWIVDTEHVPILSPKSTPMECSVLINSKCIVYASVSVT